MTSLSRLLFFNLVLTAGVLLCVSATGYGQTTEAKPKPTGSISGRALMGGKGAPGIAVVAYGGEREIRRAAAQATTDSEGRYRLFGLAAGTYQVSALAPNYASAEPLSLSAFGPSSGLSKSIILAPAENVEDIDLKLVRGGVITGRIKDAEGKPVIEQQVAVAAVDENGAPAKIQQPPSYNYQMYQTDDRGVYRIYGLPAGHYKVSVGTDPARGSSSLGTHTYYPQTFFGDVSDPAKATIVELSEGGEAGNIDIQVGHRGETYTATGRIIDADSGEPIAGVRYMYGPAPKNQPNFFGGYIGPATNSRGEFRIEGIEPGRYGVTLASDFEASSVYTDPSYFEVTDGDISNLELKATRGTSMSGVLVTDGVTNKDVLAQLTSMRVTARLTSNTNPQTSNSGSSLIAGDGSFFINGLRPGKASLYLSTVGTPGIRGLLIAKVERDGADVTRTLEVKAGQPVTDLRVILVYGTGTIRGTVKFENGTPPSLSRVFVGARREGAVNYNYGAQLDARGRFVIANLPAGTYEVILNLGFPIGPTPPQQRPPQPKQFVTVGDDAEAEVTFTVDLKPGQGGP
jgi:protocatechuate 3,4-dioxygenase beta subunit